MFIHAKPSEDENALRFFPGQRLLPSGMENGGLDYADTAQASAAPLAQRLLFLDGVARVRIEAETVLVERRAGIDWAWLKPLVIGVIMDHLMSGAPVVDAAAIRPIAPDPASVFAPCRPAPIAEDEALAGPLAELVEARIAPAVERLGGAVRFLGVHDGAVRIELINRGFTEPAFSLKLRIENTVRHDFPEIDHVVIVEPLPDTPELDMSNPLVAAVHDVLENQINPAVAAHGGRITLIEVNESVAHVRFEGGCQGCGMAAATLQEGVRRMILETVPGIEGVVDATDHAAGANPYMDAHA